MSMSSICCHMLRAYQLHIASMKMIFIKFQIIRSYSSQLFHKNLLLNLHSSTEMVLVCKNLDSEVFSNFTKEHCIFHLKLWIDFLVNKNLRFTIYFSKLQVYIKIPYYIEEFDSNRLYQYSYNISPFIGVIMASWCSIIACKKWKPMYEPHHASLLPLFTTQFVLHNWLALSTISNDYLIQINLFKYTHYYVNIMSGWHATSTRSLLSIPAITYPSNCKTLAQYGLNIS